MIKFKRFLAVLLSSALIFSMTACGKDNEEDKSKEAGTKTESNDNKEDSDKDELSAADIYEAMEKGFALNKGTYDCEIVVEGGLTDSEGNVTIGINGTVDGTAGTMGMKLGMDVEGVALTFDFSDLLTYVDGKAYISIDSLVKAVSDVDTTAGSYGFPLPEVADVDSDKMMGFTMEMMKALFTNAEAEQDGDTFTITLETAEDYEKGVTALVNYLDENQDEIEAAMKDSMNSVDVQQYLKDLIEYASDDVISVFELLGSPITQADIDEIVDSIDEMEIDDAQVEIFEDLEDVVEEINGMTSEDWEKAMDGEMVTSLSVTLNKDGFKLDFSLEAVKGEESVSASCTYNFTIDDSVSVKAPEDATTLTAIVQYVMDNPQIIQEIGEAINELADKLGDLIDKTSVEQSVIEYPGIDVPDIDDDPYDGVQTFDLESGGSVTVDYDTDVYECDEADKDYRLMYLSTIDGSYSSLDIMINDYSDAKSLYDYCIELFADYTYEGDGVEILDNGTTTVNGITAYYMELESGYEDMTKFYYFIDLSDNYSAELDVYRFSDCDFTVEEMVEAVYFN
ncbi:MAG: hypothetical protein ACI39R_06210 [Lachnospiraceae bacterium]